MLYRVPWSAYVTLRDALDDQSGLKMTYLEGTLELMSPSALHEQAKKIIARLLEAWADERDVDLEGIGGATFRREAEQRGLEPDECYKLDEFEDGDFPDIAIEVIVTNSLVDKMAVYAGLGVPEVWEWRPDTASIVVNRLLGNGYKPFDSSALLPDLDLIELSRFVRPGERQSRLVKEYRAALRSR